MNIQLLPEQKFEVVCKLDGKTEPAQDAIVLTGTEKKCTKCLIIKPYEEFGKDKKTPDGLYYICKPCSRNHNAEYYKANSVKARANAAVYRKANPNYKAEWDKKHPNYYTEWHKANPDYATSEKIKAYCAEWKKANPEKAKAWKAKWRNAYPEKEKAASVKWAKANPEKVKETHAAWVRTNPEKVKAHKHKRRARKLAAGGSFTADDIKALLKSQKGKCVACGANIKKAYHIDHIMPLSLGGHNGIGNIQLLCQHCNQTKSAKHPIDWMQERGFLL